MLWDESFLLPGSVWLPGYCRWCWRTRAEGVGMWRKGGACGPLPGRSGQSLRITCRLYLICKFATCLGSCNRYFTVLAVRLLLHASLGLIDVRRVDPANLPCGHSVERYIGTELTTSERSQLASNQSYGLITGVHFFGENLIFPPSLVTVIIS